LTVGLLIVALLVFLALESRFLGVPIYLQVLVAFFVPFMAMSIWGYVRRYVDELYDEHRRPSDTRAALGVRLEELRQLRVQGLIEERELRALRSRLLDLRTIEGTRPDDVGAELEPPSSRDRGARQE
jgi:hypothetical protein